MRIISLVKVNDGKSKSGLVEQNETVTTVTPRKLWNKKGIPRGVWGGICAQRTLCELETRTVLFQTDNTLGWSSGPDCPVNSPVLLFSLESEGIGPECPENLLQSLLN